MRLVHQRLCREFTTAKLHYGRSTKVPRTVRLSSVHPANFGYTGGLLLSKARTVHRRSADSPPVLGRIYQKQFQSAVRSNFSEADGPLQGSRTVRSCAKQWGQPELTYIEGSLSFSPTNPHQTSKRLSLFLSQACGGDDKVKAFLAWFPDGPSTSPDSSRGSPSCPLGISMIPLLMFLDFIMKEVKVWGAPIYFWTMDL